HTACRVDPTVKAQAMRHLVERDAYDVDLSLETRRISSDVAVQAVGVIAAAPAAGTFFELVIEKHHAVGIRIVSVGGIQGFAGDGIGQGFPIRDARNAIRYVELQTGHEAGSQKTRCSLSVETRFDANRNAAIDPPAPLMQYELEGNPALLADGSAGVAADR